MPVENLTKLFLVQREDPNLIDTVIIWQRSYRYKKYWYHKTLNYFSLSNWIVMGRINRQNLNISMHRLVIMLGWAPHQTTTVPQYHSYGGGGCRGPAVVQYSLCWLSVTSPANSIQQGVRLTGPQSSWLSCGLGQAITIIPISNILSDLSCPTTTSHSQQPLDWGHHGHTGRLEHTQHHHQRYYWPGQQPGRTGMGNINTRQKNEIIRDLNETQGDRSRQENVLEVAR